MEIAYISSACKKENKSNIDKTAKVKLENNIIKFHNSIIKGLAKNIKGTENITSFIGLPISIKTNKKIFWKKKVETENNIIYNQLAFINFPIIKQYTIKKSIKRSLKSWVKKNRNKDSVIIIDATYVSIIEEVMKIAKKNSIRVIGIFADIYDYMYDVLRNSGKSNLIKKIYRKKSQKCYEKMYGYVFLTEPMNKLINKNNKPYVIMEGIVDSENNYDKDIENKFKRKTIFYAGGLKTEYGIVNLIKAFNKITIDCDLIICGDGELKEYVKNESTKNPRLKYLGVINNEKVMEYERKSTVLVNPRLTNKEYTKYSFPSKIMEYMLSGTPVISTKLDGIPEEYFKYIYIIKENKTIEIKRYLEKILQKASVELNRTGKAAKKFVIQNKNNVKQTKLILKLIE